LKPQGELDHACMLKIGLTYDGEFKNELKIMSNLLNNIILLTGLSHLIPIYPSIIHPDVLCTFYVVDIDSLLYIMTLLDSSVVAVLCDCML